MAEAAALSASKATTSPFASQVAPATTLPAADVTMAQESQAPRAVSPNTLPSRPASAQGFRSPSSWFNRTSSSTSSGHLKHSLLDMVPSQPLNRPISSAPPSPASQLQPPTIPALEQLKQGSGSARLAEAPAPSPMSPQTSAPKELAAEHAEGAQGTKDAKQEQVAGLTDEKRMKKDRRMRKTEANMRWQLMRRLADISSDVELLNHEVHHWQTAWAHGRVWRHDLLCIQQFHKPFCHGHHDHVSLCLHIQAVCLSAALADCVPGCLQPPGMTSCCR